MMGCERSEHPIIPILGGRVGFCASKTKINFEYVKLKVNRYYELVCTKALNWL